MSFLIATDLDGTLVGPTAEDREALRTLNRAVEEAGAALIYVTGRSLTKTLELITEAQLLIPKALVTSVGTAIYSPTALDGPDAHWSAVLQEGWDLQTIDSVTRRYPILRPQPESEQGPFKRSFFLAPSQADCLPSIDYELCEAGLKVRLVYSSDRDLDILPLAGVKGKAVQFLQERWSHFSDRTVVCGDSGNDLSLFETGNRGIAVGNALPELSTWLRSQPELPVYCARERCAGGILEGLRYWQFL